MEWKGLARSMTTLHLTTSENKVPLSTRVLIGLPLLLMGLGCAAMAVPRLLLSHELSTQGQSVTALVLQRSQGTGKSSGIMELKYAYQVGGHQYHGEDQVQGELFRATRRGDSVPIVYSASHPDHSQTVSSTHVSSGSLLLLIGLIGVVAGASAFALPMKPRSQEP